MRRLTASEKLRLEMVVVHGLTWRRLVEEMYARLSRDSFVTSSNVKGSFKWDFITFFPSFFFSVLLRDTAKEMVSREWRCV